MARVERRLAILTWLVGANVAMTTALLLRLLV